ncbi:hypothetical protein SAMN05216249_10289 [Acetitomaculum ruminis DSM 5522]|uniref:Uncharacterized protein n=1 Tax=Acetitomaculum ruminis DSM 5522 TaxID=1120918 RepID=A0A1I0VMN7_9FIRM|nr:hypothetical protein [Acetitomaculum ruminis]SFA77498.1 hypothetical protein SAMN05216249_10289 [Acetitomaculum ruminis DSM 5522]
MNKIIYVKCSDSRSEKFALRTSIELTDEGKKIIRKSASFEEGKAHIKNINKNYESLLLRYKDSELNIQKCKMEGETITFEYAEGESLTNIIERYLVNHDYDRIKKILLRCFELIRFNSVPSFNKTEKFKEIFGDFELSDTHPSSDKIDIDMVIDNFIIDKDDNWTLIDYEWSYDFSVPVDFVVYRCIHFFYHRMSVKLFTLDELFELGNMEKNEIAIYEKMERNFQAYVSKDYSDIGRMRDIIGNKIINVYDLMESYDAGINEIKRLANELEKTRTELNAIKNTKTWKLRNKARAIIKKS